MTAPKALVAGNWKMNGLKAATSEINRLNDLINEKGAKCDVLICPPFTLISTLVDTGAQHVAIGAQDCHMNVSGAHTGDISAEMVKELGCGHIIVGHSERRADHGESNETVKAKASAAQAQGAIAIIRVGETIDEREAGKALDIVTSQVKASIPDDATADNTIIAYEPVWAIGTGLTATPEQAQEMHSYIRRVLAQLDTLDASATRVLYGGSVKPGNAAELFAAEDIDGALVGGASLAAEDFAAIIAAA